MTGGQPRRRAMPRPRTNAQIASRLTNLEHRLTGHKTIPQDNPPAFVSLPWNNFTFERTQIAGQALGQQVITVQDILAQIAARCGLATSPPNVADVRVKVLSAQVWGTVGATLTVPEIATEFYELAGDTPATQRPRSSQRDVGTLNKPAKVGYSFPQADRKEVVADDATALKIAATTAVYEGMYITTRVQVLWQSSSSE